jgi:hypothetical protein
MCEFDEIYHFGDCYQSFAGYYCYRIADSAVDGFASYVEEEGCFDFLICAGVVVSTLLCSVFQVLREIFEKPNADLPVVPVLLLSFVSRASGVINCTP